jgi:hypothetical protein
MTDGDEKRFEQRLEWLAAVHEAGRYAACIDCETLSLAVVDTGSEDQGLVIGLSKLARTIGLLSEYDLTMYLIGSIGDSSEKTPSS